MKSTRQLKVDVYFTPAHLDEMQLKDKNIVVVDVLRASTTIATALCNGAKEIIPVSTVESVVKISGSLFGDVTLRAGERNAKMIEGFNLGNSPLEYTEEVVRGKSIIFMTTNGSAAMVKGRHAKNLVVAGFVNLSAVVEFLAELHNDFIIVCAGKESNFCLEDSVCAGKIISKLDTVIDDNLILNDAAVATVTLEKTIGKGVLKMLRNSEHGKLLSEMGFEGDLKVCAEIDSLSVLPVMTGNVLRLHKGSKQPSQTDAK
ncbi:MAG: 2-phosphosulfolactate phosphatase [Ignavibacteria bacterium]|nr:2-phosphosulfolactate phosphatase [Ignavibacteria bacterium]MBI3765068.1 2-phosphosulfolactate phosphatase [Ignavibacteriales bacterium]